MRAGGLGGFNRHQQSGDAHAHSEGGAGHMAYFPFGDLSFLAGKELY